MLCSLEEPKIDEKSTVTSEEISLKKSEDSVSHFYQNHVNSKQFIHDFYAYNFGIIIPENGVPEATEDNLIHEKYPVELKKSNKRQNDNMDFDVEFQHSSGAFTPRKSPEIPESDIETLVSSDFGVSDYYDIFCNAQGNGDRLQFRTGGSASDRSGTNVQNNESTSSDQLRTRLETPHSSQRLRAKSTHESCPYCSPPNTTELTLERTATSLENCLRKLHENCTCGLDGSSQEQLTPSREIMRQVMRRVEIVPPGQQISGYSSSVENSPRAYHHGLLSHSFPTNPAHHPQCAHSETSERRKVKRASRRHSVRNSSVPSEVSSPRRCNSNYRNNTQPTESWTANPTYSSPLMIPRVQHLRNEEGNDAISDATYSSCSSCQSISSVSSPEWDSTRLVIT